MSCEIIDVHAHLPTDGGYLEKLRMIRRRYDISRTVLASGNLIPVGRIGDFLRGTTGPHETIPNNGYLREVVNDDPGSFGAFFTVDPRYHTDSDFVTAIDDGFCGFKFNTIVHNVTFADPDLDGLYDVASAGRIPVYLHITLSEGSRLEDVSAVARKHRAVPFIIAHMGYSTSDFGALKLAADLENVFLESSIGSVVALEEVQKRGMVQKLLFGSEFPLHSPGVELQKLRTVFSDGELARICDANARGLLKACFAQGARGSM